MQNFFHWTDSEKTKKEYAELEAKFLEGMSKEQLKLYDKLVQKVWNVGYEDALDSSD